MATLRTLTIIAATALLLPAIAHAGKFRDFDDYRVHFSAFSSTIIAPEVARAYNLPRSDYRGMLNITVQHKEDDSPPYPGVNADLQVQATNLANQTKQISMQRIEEGAAIYYIGGFPVSDREVLNFRVNIQPEGSDQIYDLQFQQQFFTSDRD
ncbi:DUF4426 domain-containing protein [Thiohalomonas denitrificans]|uniref:DUF4426 domain-containing protein n=1 Tax=Thiohalomonas denitrificans TaxID=415747 RepID=A0A1G5QKT1_9GAMM|nr:DUF4426 domain-containing protein [Thiohalomonas denitrificans]SCZ61931.1 protein of unknown function [Thiohalomonas denitrificans]